MARRIGILTGGGDVPGLNSIIKEVVYRATENDCEVLGIRRGWEGLTHLDHGCEASREKYLLPLDRANTRTIDRFGGTILHSSRVSPTRLRSLPEFLAGETLHMTHLLGLVMLWALAHAYRRPLPGPNLAPS